MSFLQRARDAAAQAADQARQATERVTDAEHRDALRTGMSRAGDQARDAAHIARRGMRTVIERIDPGTLAEVVVRATALQEMTNRALVEKGSPYRIAEIAISASVPPGVTFSIARVHDPGTGAARASTELADAADEAGTILSLDASPLDASPLDPALAPLLDPEIDDPDEPAS